MSNCVAWALILILTCTWEVAAKSIRVETADDDLTACRPVVQKRIDAFRRDNLNLHFSCKDGFLYQLFMPPWTSIASGTAEQFAGTHWELFLSSAPKQPLKFERWGTQVFDGVQIAGRFATKAREILVHGEGPEYTMFMISVTDTSQWHLKPKAVLNEVRITELARKHDQDTGIKAEWDYRPDNFPMIHEHLCANTPALAWKVLAFSRRPPTAPPTDHVKLAVRAIYIDAQTGKVCSQK